MEIEKFFKCPSCRERISMLIDSSEDGAQSYVEDCEVCCRPIQISFTINAGQISDFDFALAY